MSAQRLEGCVRILRPHDLHQLHFLELVLADHAARITPRGARLGTKTRRLRSKLQRQCFGRDNLIAHQVRHRHLGGRDQIKPLLTAHREQLVFEFRQLAGADQRRGRHQIRRIDLGITVLARVQIEHELRQRALQPRQPGADHDEARARNAAGGFKIELAE